MMESIDHVKKGWARVALQYKQSPKFYLFICELLSYINECEDVVQQLMAQVDIDVAEGPMLDAIGNIVGASRIVPAAIPLKFFGFLGQPGADIFGEEGNRSIGSRFREEGEAIASTSVLNDPEYRLLLRAKIVRNNSIGSQEDVIEGLKYLFNTEAIVVSSNLGRMRFQISIGRPLTYGERVLLNNFDLLARPAGVRIRRKSFFNQNRYFGFVDQPGALGFGEEGDPTVGGILAEEF